MWTHTVFWGPESERCSWVVWLKVSQKVESSLGKLTFRLTRRVVAGLSSCWPWARGLHSLPRGLSEATRVSARYGSWPPQSSKRERAPKVETAVCQNPVVKVPSCPSSLLPLGVRHTDRACWWGRGLHGVWTPGRWGSSGPSGNLATTLRQRCFLNSMIKEAN